MRFNDILDDTAFAALSRLIRNAYFAANRGESRLQRIPFWSRYQRLIDTTRTCAQNPEQYRAAVVALIADVVRVMPPLALPAELLVADYLRLLDQRGEVVAALFAAYSNAPEPVETRS